MSRGRSSSSGSRGRSSSSRGRSSSYRSNSSSIRSSSSHRSGSRASVYYNGGILEELSPREKEKNTIIGLIICAIFCFMFGATSTYLFIDSCIVASRYGQTIGYVITNDLGAGYYYYTTYRYEVNGIEYESRSEVGWEYIEEDDTAVIYYLKSNPDIVTDEIPYNEDGPGLLILGIAMLAVTVLLIVIAVKKHIKLSKIIKKEELANTPITCPYCRTVLSSNVDKCPNCGANNRKK